MNGDYTKVPLRRDERWTGARMQEGRVLLDHEWNLNLDAAARTVQAAARDAIGPAGVPAGSDAFRIGVTPSGALDLTVAPGRMWVDGLLALAPTPFGYSSQDQIAALPTTGTVFVYLDVFVEHVQPGEDPLELLDPALAQVDSAARTRIGYRVRVRPTTATSCAAAFAELDSAAESTGTMSIARIGPPAPTDPCAPPGDPLGRLPDGLFRVEVLDSGTATTARFAWSYEDGAATVAIAEVAGSQVTLAPSPAVKFATGDLVEVSWLARRADRADHGALYTVGPVTPGAGGDVVTLDRAVAAPTSAVGLALRRWDGQVTGAAANRSASLRGADVGVRFRAAAGAYRAGDWWGARLREEAGTGIEHRTGAPPDGTRHAFAPLALVSLDTRQVLHDCRPRFQPLVDLDTGGGACTVTVEPGDDVQAAVDALPPGGGEVCFAAGLYRIAPPVQVGNRRRVVFAGAGPASVLGAARSEAVVVFDDCAEVEVRHLRVEGGSPGRPPGDPHLNGALTFTDCTDVKVADCVLTCPDSSGKQQTCLTVRSRTGGQPDGIRVERNRVELGAWQTGVLLVGAARAVVAGNHVVVPAPASGRGRFVPDAVLARAVRAAMAASVRPEAGTGTRAIAVSGVGEVHVLVGSPGEALVEDFARLAGPVAGRAGLTRAIGTFARSLRGSRVDRVDQLSAGSRDFLDRLRRGLQAGLQGIVVGGGEIGTVQILDNVVEGTIQGVHVGASDPRTQARDAARDVVISRNVVHAVVPSGYDRERHAVFVGNARSAHVLDTVATVTRPDTPGRRQPVEGIRVWGALGQFLVVRQTSLQGFDVGVRVKPLGATPKSRLWLVAETMAVGSSPAVDAPSSVELERNVA